MSQTLMDVDRILAAIEPRLDEFGEQYPGGAVVAHLADDGRVIAQLFKSLKASEAVSDTLGTAVVIPLLKRDEALAC